MFAFPGSCEITLISPVPLKCRWGRQLQSGQCSLCYRRLTLTMTVSPIDHCDVEKPTTTQFHYRAISSSYLYGQTQNMAILCPLLSWQGSRWAQQTKAYSLFTHCTSANQSLTRFRWPALWISSHLQETKRACYAAQDITTAKPHQNTSISLI